MPHPSTDGHLVLDPALNRIAKQAFEAAWKAVPPSDEASSARVREVLAQRIVQMLQLGERDPIDLERDAIQFLAYRLPR